MNPVRICRGVLAVALMIPLTPSGAASAPEFACELGPQSQEQILDRAHRFILALLALSPVAATQAGYHSHLGKSLDSELDDYSPETIDRQRRTLLNGQACFDTSAKLRAEDAADLAVLHNAIKLNLLQLQDVQPHRYRPDSYVELIGSGLFFPLTQTQGTQEQRLANAVSRMEQVSRLLAQAKQQLIEADPIFIDTAREENTGNRQVIEQIGAMIPAGSALRKRYETAAASARSALEDFSRWLETDLAARPHTRSWRAGKELYGKIFPLALGTGPQHTPSMILASAEADLDAIQDQMLAVAKPLHAQWFGTHAAHENLERQAQRTQIIAEVLDRIADDHATPATLLGTVQAQLDQIHKFIIERDLLTLSLRDNLKVIPTPAFLRGIYAVAGFNPAPPLDPGAQAQYWVTPIEAGTAPEQAESKLREYNNWMLYYLSMHEALPGHYTQFEHANAIQPSSRRLLRVLLSNNPYVEGWGEYAVKEMVDAGFANGDPRFVLMVLKIRLRVAVNAILDIRMHSQDMTDSQALELMQQRAFQTTAEAQGKLRRAKLSLAQLPTYYVGFRQWNAMRDHAQHELGSQFSLKRFNDIALDEGPLPIAMLDAIVIERMKRETQR